MTENVPFGKVEDELIPISALNQYCYCPRRCALIHIEQVWDENRFTAEGKIMHEHVHEQGDESRGNVKIGRGIPLRSLRLGLVGVADVVEFHRINRNVWQPYPVEYKRGKPKPDSSDLVQLCAQAICLEEMLSVPVPKGALFYGRTRRRLDVPFDKSLRARTEEAARIAHDLIESGVTPPPVYGRRCESCSLLNECMPRNMEKRVSVKHYLKRMIEAP